MALTTIWLIIFVACIVIEIATMGLVTIWFAGGSLLAAIVAAVGGPLWLQVVLFLGASVVLLYLTRPIAVKQKKERNKFLIKAFFFIFYTSLYITDTAKGKRSSLLQFAV